MLEYLTREMNRYATLVGAYAGNEEMQGYMSQKVQAYADACDVIRYGMPIAPTLETLAMFAGESRYAYKSEIRAILRTMPR